MARGPRKKSLDCDDNPDHGVALVSLLCPHPHRVVALSVDGRRLSVCPSVPCLTIRREGRMQRVENWQRTKPMTRVIRDLTYR